VVAEVELESVEQPFELPPWVGKEVSDDTRYLNACLAKHPYREWGDYARGRVKAR
jgi:adenylate cyclase